MRVGQRVKVISTKGGHHCFSIGDELTIIEYDFDAGELAQHWRCENEQGTLQYMRACEIVPLFESYLKEAEQL